MVAVAITGCASVLGIEDLTEFDNRTSSSSTNGGGGNDVGGQGGDGGATTSPGGGGTSAGGTGGAGGSQALPELVSSQIQDQPVAIALDGDFIYWLNQGDDRILKASKGVNQNPTELADRDGIPQDLVVDGGDVFWTNHADGETTPPGKGTVLALPTSPAGIFPLYATMGKRPTNLAKFGDHLYWTDPDDGEVYHQGTVPLYPPDPPANVVDSVFGSEPHGIAADADGAYWADYVLDSIRFSVDYATADKFASSEDGPWDVALSSSHVFWTNKDGGTIRKKEKTGGSSAETIAGAQLQPTAITVDAQGQWVFWITTDGNVMYVDAAGVAKAKALAPGQSTPSDIAVDDTHVYWCNQGSGEIMRIAKP